MTDIATATFNEITTAFSGETSWVSGLPVPAPLEVHSGSDTHVLNYYSDRCRLCKAGKGPEVNALARKGHMPTGIWRMLADDFKSGPEPITVRVIENHLARHSDNETARIAAAMQEHAAKMGREIEAITVPTMVFAREMLTRTWKKAMDNPNWVPNFQEATALIKVIEDHDTGLGDTPDAQVIAHVVSSMVISAQRVLPPELYEKWMIGVRNDPAVLTIIEAERRKAAINVGSNMDSSQDSVDEATEA